MPANAPVCQRNVRPFSDRWIRGDQRVVVYRNPRLSKCSDSEHLLVAEDGKGRVIGHADSVAPVGARFWSTRAHLVFHLETFSRHSQKTVHYYCNYDKSYCMAANYHSSEK